MARLVTVGFEIATTEEPAQATGGGLSFETAIVRSGSRSLKLVNGTATFYVPGINTTTTKIFSRVWIYFGSYTTAEQSFMNIGGDSSGRLYFKLRESAGQKQMQVLDDISQIIVDWTNVTMPATGAWTKWTSEYDATPASGSRICNLYCDDTLVLGITNGTFGQSSDTTYILTVANGASATYYIDDLAINDNSGAAPHNTMPSGAAKIIALLPNAAGDGDTTVSLVGEATAQECLDDFNDATSYVNLSSNASEVVVAAETGTSKGVGASDTIYFVEVHARCAGANNNPTNWIPGVMSQSSGAKTYGTTVSWSSNLWYTNAPGASADRTSRLRAFVDHTSNPWSLSTLNALQLIARGTDGNPDMYVSTLWAYVEYVPAVTTADWLPQRTSPGSFANLRR